MDVDILGAASFDDEIAWWENDGDENFTKHVINTYFDEAYDVFAIDMDKDNDIDVLGTAIVDDEIAWWENDGDENFTKHTITSNFEGSRHSIYAADINKDNEIDIIGSASGILNNEISWWENDGNENFTKHTITSNFDSVTDVLAIDIDGDNEIDILGASSSDDEIAWWKNDGMESFTKYTVSDDFSAPYSVFATDVDGDLDIDILGAASGDGLAWWEQGVKQTNYYLSFISMKAGPPRTAPILNNISNPGGSRSFTVSWNEVEKATSYVLEEDDNNWFSSPTTKYSGSSTSKLVSTAGTGEFFYRVKATNQRGSSPWSNIESVVVTQTGIVPQPGEWDCNVGFGKTVRFTVSPDGTSVIDGKITISCGSLNFPGPSTIQDNYFNLDDPDGHIQATFDSDDHCSGGYSIFLSDSCWALGTMHCSP
jgi:hypothetical protein